VIYCLFSIKKGLICVHCQKLVHPEKEEAFMTDAKLQIRLVLGALVLSFATSAKASAPMCTDIFTSARFTKMDDKVTDTQVAVFEKVVTDLNSRLGDLVTPKGVEIQVFTEHSSPAANPLDMSIRAGVRYFQTIPKNGIAKFYKKRDLSKLKKYHKSPSFSVPILAHEYGHLIFMENYTLREPIWRDAFETYKNLIPVLNEMQKNRDALKKQMDDIFAQMKDPAVTTERRIELIGKIKSLGEEMSKISDQASALMKPVKAVMEINTSYNEFFADVVAVLYTGKSGVIDGGVSFTRSLQGNNKFTKETKHSDTERNFENHLEHDGDYEGHGYFSLARNDIWNSYLVSPSYRARSGEIMTAVFDAVAKENSRILQNPIDMATDANWKQLNQSLTDAIERELAARGIEKLK
jgi:hypothetical protein